MQDTRIETFARRAGERDRRRALWIVIPAHNEERRLKPTLDGFLRRLRASDQVVVVVNGSHDRTSEIASAFAHRDPRVHVIVELDKIGKGGSLVLGFRYVCERANVDDAVCFTDADGAVDVTEIVRLISDLEPGDLVIGSRWARGAVQVRTQPFGRRVASRAFNVCVRTAFSLGIRDTQCPAKALTARDLPRLAERLTSNGFTFDLDFILAAFEQGLNVRETPIVWEDQPGSTVSIRHAGAIAHDLRLLHDKYTFRRAAVQERAWRVLPSPAMSNLSLVPAVATGPVIPRRREGVSG